MRSTIQQQRIRRLDELEQEIERIAKVASKRDPDCICFPSGSSPLVGDDFMEQISWAVKCRLHGDRYSFRGDKMYTPCWARDEMYQLVIELSPTIFRNSPSDRAAQYQKAYLAALPPDLFPAENLEFDRCNPRGPRFRLKNGVLLGPDIRDQVRATALILQERGLLIDPEVFA